MSAKLQKNHGLHLGRGIPIPFVNKKIPAARLKIIPSKDIFLTAKDIKKTNERPIFEETAPRSAKIMVLLHSQTANYYYLITYIHMLSDIEIARSIELRPIDEIAEKSASRVTNWNITAATSPSCPLS